MSESFPVIHLARHGETAWSLTGQHTGLTDVPLTERGERAARRLGERLAGLEFAKIFTSPLQRASRTCELAGFGVSAEIDHDLVEWNYGKFEGLRTAEILAEHPGWQLFRDGCPGGESVEQISARADRVVSRVRAIQGDVLIFSSGHILRVLAARWIDLEPATARFFVLNTASLSALGYENNLAQPAIRVWNDTRHLLHLNDSKIRNMKETGIESRRGIRKQGSNLRPNVLVIDIGGTHVKALATGQENHREFDSGPALTPKRMISQVRKLVADWKYDVVSIGYPGPVLRNRPVSDPWNLGTGWVGFNFETAFQCPVRILNDAAMQALGSYKRGKMLFLGLGTGLGSALIVNGIVEPMELGHLPYKKATFEDYVGIRGLEKYGKKKWREHVADVVARLVAAIEPGEVVLGGGNVKKLKELPSRCRLGNNANAFLGGFRLWEEPPNRETLTQAKPNRKQTR